MREIVTTRKREKERERERNRNRKRKRMNTTTGERLRTWNITKENEIVKVKRN